MGTKHKEIGEMTSKFATLLGLMTGLLLATPALAEWRTPAVEQIKVECAYRAGQMHTVRLTLKFLGFGTDSYEFLFTNAQGQQTRFYEMVSSMGTGTFPVAAGTHKLTVRIVGRPEANTVVPKSHTGMAIYENIIVPQPISTQGRGTGCAFP